MRHRQIMRSHESASALDCMEAAVSPRDNRGNHFRRGQSSGKKQRFQRGYKSCHPRGVASFVSLVTPFLFLNFGRRRSLRAQTRLFLHETTEAIIFAEGSRVARNNASAYAFSPQTQAFAGTLPIRVSLLFCIFVCIRTRPPPLEGRVGEG